MVICTLLFIKLIRSPQGFSFKIFDPQSHFGGIYFDITYGKTLIILYGKSPEEKEPGSKITPSENCKALSREKARSCCAGASIPSI